MPRHDAYFTFTRGNDARTVRSYFGSKISQLSFAANMLLSWNAFVIQTINLIPEFAASRIESLQNAAGT